MSRLSTGCIKKGVFEIPISHYYSDPIVLKSAYRVDDTSQKRVLFTKEMSHSYRELRLAK